MEFKCFGTIGANGPDFFSGVLHLNAPIKKAFSPCHYFPQTGSRNYQHCRYIVLKPINSKKNHLNTIQKLFSLNVAFSKVQLHNRKNDRIEFIALWKAPHPNGQIKKAKRNKTTHTHTSIKERGKRMTICIRHKCDKLVPCEIDI